LRGLLIGLIVAMPVGPGKLAMLSSHFSMGRLAVLHQGWELPRKMPVMQKRQASA